MAKQPDNLLNSLANEAFGVARAAASKVDETDPYVSLVNERVMQVSKVLQVEMRQLYEQHRQELELRYEQETRQLKRRAFWQWLATFAALVATVVGWLFRG